MEKVNVSKARIIYGFPTTGKSYLAKRLRVRGVNVFDTDDLIEVYAPRWFREKLWRTAPPEEHRDLDCAVGRAAYSILTRDNHSVMVTNLWGEDFRRSLGNILNQWGGKLPVGAVRTDPKEVSALSDSRGGSGIPLDLAEKWVRALPGIELAVHKLVHMPPEEPHLYLSDVIAPTWPFALPGVKYDGFRKEWE